MTEFRRQTGANFLCETLSSQGVTSIFGCSNDFDHFCNYPSFSLNLIKLKHEQAAIHAADGYARATGQPGVAIINTASGVASAVTGVATAYSDSVPIIVITCLLQKSKAVEELNISTVYVPITKHIFTVKNANELSAIICEAFFIANEGRPGPVVIELPEDILHDKGLIAPDEFHSQSIEEHVKKPSNQRTKRQFQTTSFEKAIEYIENAIKPVLFIGGGTIISGASELLYELVKKTGIPVVSSLMGIGAFPSSNQLFLGMLGMHGTFAANKAVHQADLLISIGVRFGDRVTGKISAFSPRSKKIHVDIDPAEINKIVQVDLPIVSDAKVFLGLLNDNLDFRRVHKNIQDWVSLACEWQRTVPRFDKSTSILRPQKVIKLLDEFSGTDSIVVTDVGQHQIWTAHHFSFSKPRQLLTSGGLGTMGYGLPAAIGASISRPESQVICVSGDGSFQMNLQELVTASSYQLPLKIAIMNNGYLGMVRQWQEMFYNNRYSSVKMTSPDFVKLAAAYGVQGYRANHEEEARKIIQTAFEHSGPVLMEFNVSEEENVFPIVPPNQSNDQLILSR